MRRTILVLVILGVLSTSAPAHARPYWKTKLDRIAAGHRIGIALYDDGRLLYQHDARAARTPASNEKLLLSMALFDTLDPATRIQTFAHAAIPQAGIIKGDLWIVGRGDPSITAGGSFGRGLPFLPTKLGDLAQAIVDAGVTTITGSVIGSTGYFEHDWFAPGWKANFPDDEVALASAVSFEGNVRNGKHISNPEIRAARALTRRLEANGVTVAGTASAGQMPKGVPELTHVESVPLAVIARFMNRQSSNFFAEMLGKRLGAETFAPPGTIAKGANAIETFGASVGVDLTAHDSSGLSYRNRVSARGIVRMLTHVELAEPWYPVLRRGLPTGGQGTLEDRLHGIPLRAKTGSLSGISALSGWIRLAHTDEWAEFSILSGGLSYYGAKGLEDRIVRLIHSAAR